MIELANVKQEHSTLETELMAVKKELKGFRYNKCKLTYGHTIVSILGDLVFQANTSSGLI